MTRVIATFVAAIKAATFVVTLDVSYAPPVSPFAAVSLKLGATRSAAMVRPLNKCVKIRNIFLASGYTGDSRIRCSLHLGFEFLS